ncbi:type VI secretion protein [Spirochaetia bacterium]|nr:type VI secretion protein [Spirochaetia bacterium]
MRFEELLHWNDGQFLQPHHFQYGQRRNFEYLHQNRQLALPFPWGLIDFELERESLSGGRVVIKRFSAIMNDGTGISMPGNCLLPPLDLTEALKQNPNELTIYLAVPFWSELEANMLDDGEKSEKKMYSTTRKKVRDENSGDNEIPIITRRINAHLVTDLDDNKDMQLLPILKLSILSHDKTEDAAQVNEKYIPPFLLITADNPLLGALNALLVDIRRCRDKALDILTVSKFKNENLSGFMSYTVMRLQALNLWETRISQMLLPSRVTPFAVYVELCSLLSQLMALDPMNSIREIKKYDHTDCAVPFFEVIKDIRSFILSQGGANYVKVEFTPVDNGMFLFAPIKTEDISSVNEIYLAVKTDASEDDVSGALEKGDTFKLVNPQSKLLRIRGMKLSKTQYPPRYLPVLEKTLWFKLELDESAHVWRQMCEEKGMVVDYAPDFFPQLELAIFITVGG